MTTFSLITTILALVIFVGFVAISVRKFGWLRSYSAFAAKWTEAVPINRHTHLWSIVTVIVALLMTCGMLEQGEGHPLQFLGFFAPVYLAIVAFTPEYETNRQQRIVHVTGALLCAAASVAWLWFAGPQGTIFFSLIAAWLLGILTRSINSSLIFWAEMAMFGAVFAARLIGGLAL